MKLERGSGTSKLNSLTAVRLAGTSGVETWIYKFTDGKSQFVWFTGFKDIEVSQTCKLTGTVKKLDEFNGVKQTVVTRCKLKL